MDMQWYWALHTALLYFRQGQAARKQDDARSAQIRAG